MFKTNFQMRILGKTIGLLMLAACSIGPDYAKPEINVPGKWHRENVFEYGQMRLDKWWKIFGDSSLDILIETARDNNPDIKIAQNRLKEAGLSRDISKSLLFPTIDTSGYLKRARFSRTLEPDAMGKTINIYGLDISAGWEIDLWGKNRRALEASSAMEEATEAVYDDALVSLYAEVAVNYVNLRTLEKRLAIAKKSIESRENNLEIVKKRYDAQLVSELDIHQAEQNLASSKAAVPALEAGIAKTKNLLTFLCGMEPGMLDDLLVADDTIPEATAKIVIDIPAEALRQRPDIRAAERTLAAQTAMIGVKKADLLPKFNLFGSFGIGAAGGALFRSYNKAWDIGSAFFWNVFDFGRISNLVKIEELKTNSAFLNYKKAVLYALTDVENAIIMYASENERMKHLKKATASAHKALEQVKILYSNGLTDFQNVLSSETYSLLHEDNFIQSQGLKTIALISLYRAFGGGWQNDSESDEKEQRGNGKEDKNDKE